jgi:NTE family protein
MRSGSLDAAIRASIALPLIFQPVKRDDRLLMDGGFSDPVPADVVRQMGADYVIAVDVTSQWVNTADEKVSWSNLYDIVSNALSVIEYQLSREILKQADLVLRPAVVQHSWLAFDRAGELIVAGADATHEELKNICRATGNPLPDETPIEKFIDFLRGR